MVTLIVRDNFGFTGTSSTTATIGEQAPPDFTVGCQHDSISIYAGGESYQTTCNVASLNGFERSVHLACESPTDPGVTWSFNPSQVTPPSNSSIDSTLTVSADFEALLDTHYLKRIGTSEGRTFTATIRLYVQPV